MTSTITLSPSDTPRPTRRRRSEQANPKQRHVQRRPSSRRRGSARTADPLGRYVDACGRRRELIVRSGLAGSVLILDCDVMAPTDRMLVAHIGADEPPENAEIICESYMSRVRQGGCRCRQATAEDFSSEPLVDIAEPAACNAGREPEPRDGLGRSYRLVLIDSGMSIPELRWCRLHDDQPGRRETISVRESVGGLEAYEPVRSLTKRALMLHRDDDTVSTAVLQVELARLLESPIVLNRGLRDAVARATRYGQLSMSEIAIRCGRVKYDSAGNSSGETSWLARRLGVLPEGGRHAPTPWVHSDVLALIARRGLGISPREAELG